MYEFIKSNSKYNYTQKDCFDLCLQKFIIHLCKCYDLNYPNLKENIKPCIENDQLNCANSEYMKFIKEDNTKCLEYCPLECNDITYEYALSSADFPTEYAYQILKNDYHFSRHKNLNYDMFKQRSLMINIYYSKLSYLSVTQLKKVEFMDLLAIIGGLLGFFIGMSLLSFIEFLEIAIDILLILFSRIPKVEMIKKAPRH